MSLFFLLQIKKAGETLRPFCTAKIGLLEVLVDQLGHLEHRDLRLAPEDRLELVVGIDHSLVLLVLQRVALDIAPDFLGDFGAWHRVRADDRSEHRARHHRLHECRIGLALLACRLLRLLLRHRASPLKIKWSDPEIPPAYDLAVGERCRIPRGMSIVFREKSALDGGAVAEVTRAHADCRSSHAAI